MAVWTRCGGTLFPICLYLLVTSITYCEGDDCLPYPFPMNVYINETSAIGSVIFVSNDITSLKNEWSVTSIEPRIALRFVEQTYQVVLLSAVDLDVANLGDTCLPPVPLVQRITCYQHFVDPVIHWITFHVRPVNDNQPEIESIPNIQISEGNVSVPLFLLPMLDYFKDRDCPKERLLLSISNYSSVEEDASEYFRRNSTTGYLYQIKQFDYEEKTIQCGIMGKEGGFLNITAEDGLHKTSKPLRVMFINIDDAPPVFVDSICSTVCFPCPVETLTAIVHITDQGTIFTNPPAIKAIDPYTVQSNISYTLDFYPTKYTDIIRFDNGTFVLLQPFGNFSGYSEESDITLTVIVQATGSNGQTSDKLFFTLTVSVRPISSTSQQITVQTSTGPTNNTTNTRLSLYWPRLSAFFSL